MADFPALIPNEINFDAGAANLTKVETFAGPVRFRRSSRINGHTLQLTYRGLSQSQINEIRTHYSVNNGSAQRFGVPNGIWGGLSVVASDAEYRYLDPPQEEHTGLHYNVTINLRVLEGSLLYYILDCGGAASFPTSAFTGGPFSGFAPFILDCEGSNPSPTLLLDGGGAKL